VFTGEARTRSDRRALTTPTASKMLIGQVFFLELLAKTLDCSILKLNDIVTHLDNQTARNECSAFVKEMRKAVVKGQDDVMRELVSFCDTARVTAL
jgi:hypothetical protein